MMFWIISKESTPKAIDFASTSRSVLLRPRFRISVTAEEMKEFTEKYSDLNIESGEDIKATPKPKEKAEKKIEVAKPATSTPKTEDRKSRKNAKSKSRRR